MTTAVPTSDVQQDQNHKNEKQPDQKSKYVIFKRVDDDTWKKLGEMEADGAYDAREKAVMEYNLMEEVRDGSLEIVSLGSRFWAPKRPKVNVSESLDVS